MLNWYCSDEYREYKKIKINSTIDNQVNDFLDSSSKKLLFNLHYLNWEQKLEFISIYNHTTVKNASTVYAKSYSIDSSGLEFIVTSTNKLYRYKTYNKSIIDEKFNNIFTFEIHHLNDPTYEISKQLKNII